MHTALPFAILYFPAAHNAHGPPFGPVEPALQMQFAIDTDPSNEDDRTEHVMQEIEPAPAYVPVTHGVHTLELVALVTPEDVPAGHETQVFTLLAAVTFEYFPATQFVHTDANAAAHVPAAHATHAPFTVR